jgi:hypothetical protein
MITVTANHRSGLTKKVNLIKPNQIKINKAQIEYTITND